MFKWNDFKVTGQNRQKTLYFLIFASIISAFFIFGIFNKQTERNPQYSNNNINLNKDLLALKDYLFNKLETPFVNINYLIEKGDTLERILRKHKINNRDIGKTITEYKKYHKEKKIEAGNYVNIVSKKEHLLKKNSLYKISLPISKSTTIEIYKDEIGELKSEKIITKSFKKTLLAENRIETSLYKSAIESNVEPNVVIEFARIFGFEIDFQRDIRKNDYFKIVYEKYFDENGKFIKSGSILYAHMEVNGREISLYKFGNDDNYGYFDVNGKSVEKALMKTPINGARLSSPFGMRKHPISGFNKMHQGTDFAAPIGTPIMASGSGTITRAKWCGGGGNCIKIKHNSTYQTIYAHLSKFAKGIKAGKKVRQGQIIGYVGSTGMSTGPHLHYEVIVNGKKVNSQTLKLPSGKILKDIERKQFEIHRIKTDVLIAELIDKKK